MEGFYRQETGQDKKVISKRKKGLFQSRAPFYRGKAADNLTSVNPEVPD